MTEKVEPKQTHLPMVCVHGEEGKAAAEATRNEVMDLLSDHTGARNPHTGWFGALIYSFNYMFDAYEVRIISDMWCGVSVDVGYGENAERIFVQCDQPEDGLFVIWKLLYDRTQLPK